MHFPQKSQPRAHSQKPDMCVRPAVLALFVELLKERAQLIENSKEMPLDMSEAISSLVFAADRIADLPELQVGPSQYFRDAPQSKGLTTPRKPCTLVPPYRPNEVLEWLSPRHPFPLFWRYGCGVQNSTLPCVNQHWQGAERLCHLWGWINLSQGPRCGRRLSPRRWVTSTAKHL